MVEKQGDAVQAMKAVKLPQDDIERVVNNLKNLKLKLQELQAKLSVEDDTATLNKEAFHQAINNTLKRGLFYIPSLQIYRRVAGLYDYGPPGCVVKANVISYWRQMQHKTKMSNLTDILMVTLTNIL
ncbi:hypothetical protein SUGI_0646370 [Cryptomeria japonica]|nr:hypothetical protein SUGI_0646370 [Cryptomeria japonica]